MPDIQITVRDKIASKVDDTVYVCSNSDYTVRFDFDGEWSTYDTKTARFAYRAGYVDVLFAGDTCALPVIHNADRIYVGVYAGELHTTTPAVIPCRKSILSDGGAPADPPDDVYAQLVAALDDKISEPEEDGTDGQVLTTDGKGGRSWQTPKGGSGTTDHAELTNRDADDQHPISAITGLQTALDGKQPKGNYLTGETDPTVPAWAKSPNKPTYTAEEVGAAAAEDGKGLSANDYTDADKTKLASMPEIVVVTFSGVTVGSTASMTAIQIAQAVSAGKLVYANLDNAFYSLVSVNQVMAMFAGLTGVNTSKYFLVRNNVLQTPSTATLQATKDMVTELSSSSTNIQYPSAKAVWDALQSAGGTSLGITGATVGQIAKITAVDDTGKPTSWEPVDIPSAGSGGTDFHLIRNFALSEQADRVDITTDDNGATFQLSEVYACVRAQSYTADQQTVFFLPNGRWAGTDPAITSSNKASTSTETWQNYMIFHAVFGGGVIFAEQLPARSVNKMLESRAAAGQQIITQISFASKFAAGCEFLIVGR